MDEIHGVAKFKIHQGQLAEFKRLAIQCMELVHKKDAGTIQYAWFFNEDETECVVYEKYLNSEALLDHVANLGDVLVQIFETSEISLDVMGNPSHELLNHLEDRKVQIYLPFQTL